MEAEQNDLKRVISRGRGSPSHGLKDAIDFTRKIAGALGRGPFSRDLVAESLGHKPGTGPANSKVGSLTHFGLLDRTGNSYALSPIAMTLVHPTNEFETKLAIAEAAKSPTLYAELLEHLASKALPTMLGNLLVRQYGVVPTTSEEVAERFKATIEFAGLLRNGIVHTDILADNANDVPAVDPTATEKPVPKVGTFIQWISQGVAQFEQPKKISSVSPDGQWVQVEGSNTGIPASQISPATPPAAVTAAVDNNQDEPKTAKTKLGIRQEVFSLEAGGQIVVQWPDAMTSNDIEDMTAWFPIVLRKIQRPSSKGPTQ